MSVVIDALKTIASLVWQADNGAADEEQTAISRVRGTIWQAVLHASISELESIYSRRGAACLRERGPVGELAFHMCFLYNSPQHLQMAWKMVEMAEQAAAESATHSSMEGGSALLTAVYEKPLYQGENVLHIAIINQDLTTVTTLLNREPKLMKARATGSFFAKGQACYYGEYPLAFAACTSQRAIFDLLLSKGAEIDIVDSNHNNLLHLLVLHNLPDMYAFVEQRMKEQLDLKDEATMKKKGITPPWLRRNNEGFTPLTLAADIGCADMFSFLLEERKQTQWQYGPVSCYLYPLAELDLYMKPPTPIAADADEEKNKASSSPIKQEDEDDQRPPGALELIVNNAHTELLMHPRIIDLVQQKWDRFAKRIFFQRFISVFLYLLLFTYTTVVKQSVTRIHDLLDLEHMQREAAQQAALNSTTITMREPTELELAETQQLAHLRQSHAYTIFYTYPFCLYLLEVAVMSGACWKAKKEVNEIMSNGWRQYFGGSRGAAFLENVLSLSYCISIFFVAILNLLGSPFERVVLATASIAGWSYIFFFLLGFKMTGPMVVMIHRMLLNDVLRFCTIYLVFLIGFGQAFFVLFENSGLTGFIVAVKSCFIAMLGDFDLDEFASTPYRSVSISLLVLYVVTVTILLLNLLIAMMGDTYENVNEDAEKQWHLERARIIFAIESEMSMEEREDDSNKYWTTIAGERFLQVLDVKADHFCEENEHDANDDDDSKESADAATKQES